MTRNDSTIKSENQTEQPSGMSQWKLIWRKFKKNRLAWVGMVIVAILVVLSLFAPFFSPYDYREQDLSRTYLPPQGVHFIDNEGRLHLRPFAYSYTKKLNQEAFKYEYLEDTSKTYNIRFFTQGWEYKLFGLIESNIHLFGVEEGGSIFLFGTDPHGLDIFSRIIFGSRISLSVAILGALFSGIIGSLVGAISGYFSGVFDMLLQRLVELIQCFPQLALWMALSVAIPKEWDPKHILYGVVGIFTLLSWPLLAREVRGKVLALREMQFVLAAQSFGVSDFVIIVRHILPQVTSHIIVVLTINIPIFILAESSLSFLGLGIQPPMVSWGVMLKKAQNFRSLGDSPWLMIPGLFIVLTVLAFNFLGDGLRDAADPYAQ